MKFMIFVSYYAFIGSEKKHARYTYFFSCFISVPIVETASTNLWFIALILGVLLLFIIIALIVCYMYRNRGGTYLCKYFPFLHKLSFHKKNIMICPCCIDLCCNMKSNTFLYFLIPFLKIMKDSFIHFNLFFTFFNL